MQQQQQQQQQQHLRLPGFDYRQGESYFVTVCTKDRRCSLGSVRLDSVELSALGRVARGSVEEIEPHYPFAKLHRYVIMPNHVHLLVQLQAENGEHAERSVSTIISRFKYASTRKWHDANESKEPIWQRSFHEVIVRSEKQFNAFGKYIDENPIKWHRDQYNPGWRS
jgi:putative transposase